MPGLQYSGHLVKYVNCLRSLAKRLEHAGLQLVSLHMSITPDCATARNGMSATEDAGVSTFVSCTKALLRLQ